MAKKLSLHVKTRLWTPKGYDDFENTWEPQDIRPNQVLHIQLDARGKSFVEIKVTESPAPTGVEEMQDA